MAMQAIQPKVKAIQEKNKGKPQDETQMEVARLYQEAKINPLAGCLPTLATLPVWIGLYRCAPCKQLAMHAWLAQPVAYRNGNAQTKFCST